MGIKLWRTSAFREKFVENGFITVDSYPFVAGLIERVEAIFRGKLVQDFAINCKSKLRDSTERVT